MDNTDYALDGGPYLDYEAIHRDLAKLAHLQYGVKITWNEVDAAGRKPENPTTTHAFSTRAQAEQFAAIYDPVRAPAQGAARVEILKRETIEVYGEWASTGNYSSL